MILLRFALVVSIVLAVGLAIEWKRETEMPPSVT